MHEQPIQISKEGNIQPLSTLEKCSVAVNMKLCWNRLQISDKYTGSNMTLETMRDVTGTNTNRTKNISFGVHDAEIHFH